jgi:hypothetical protein
MVSVNIAYHGWSKQFKRPLIGAHSSYQQSGRQPLKPQKKHKIGFFTIAIALTSWINTVTVLSVANAFQNKLEFVNCGEIQKEKLQEAANILSDSLFLDGGANMRDCLNDAFLSNSSGHRTASEIWFDFEAPGTTIIQCTDNFRTECAGSHSWWGCARIGISGERSDIANFFILDPNISPARIAGIMAHEIAHNNGHDHSNLGPGEDRLTVNEQVRACVESLTPQMPSRSSIPFEVELGPSGHIGGRPFELACSGNAFGRGLVIAHGWEIDNLALHCTDNAIHGPVGNVSHPKITQMVCSSTEVLVGIHGRSGWRVDQLGVWCAPIANLGSTRVPRALGRVGGNGGLDFDSLCPPDMAVRRIQGRAGSRIALGQMK